MEQVIIKCLNIRGGQRLQLDGTQGRLDVILDIGLVGFRRSGLYMPPNTSFAKYPAIAPTLSYTAPDRYHDLTPP